MAAREGCESVKDHLDGYFQNLINSVNSPPLRKNDVTKNPKIIANLKDSNYSKVKMTNKYPKMDKLKKFPCAYCKNDRTHNMLHCPKLELCHLCGSDKHLKRFCTNNDSLN